MGRSGLAFGDVTQTALAELDFPLCGSDLSDFDTSGVNTEWLHAAECIDLDTWGISQRRVRKLRTGDDELGGLSVAFVAKFATPAKLRSPKAQHKQPLPRQPTTPD